MAKGAKKATHVSNTTQDVESYGTKKESIVAYLNDVKLSDVFDTSIKDTVVIAEDKNGFYVTAKSIAESKLLDPYRLYHRVNATKNEDGSFSWSK